MKRVDQTLSLQDDPRSNDARLQVLQSVKREIRVLGTFKHVNIILLLGYSLFQNGSQGKPSQICLVYVASGKLCQIVFYFLLENKSPRPMIITLSRVHNIMCFTDFLSDRSIFRYELAAGGALDQVYTMAISCYYSTIFCCVAIQIYI